MYTKYEEYALSIISGGESNPPKINGKLNFKDDWSQTAFALAINLSKKGFFEMEEFRQEMIKTIKDIYKQKTNKLTNKQIKLDLHQILRVYSCGYPKMIKIR